MRNRPLLRLHEQAPIQPPYGTPGAEGLFNYDPKGPSLRPEVAAQWLAVVLAAWQGMFRAALPGRIAKELEKLFNKVRST